MREGLNQSQNPAGKTSAEQGAAQDTSSTSRKKVDHREQNDVPSQDGDQAQPSSLGQGDTGPLKEKNIPNSDAQNYSQDGDLEGEQMRAPGEGEVADAVRSGGGGGHKGEESYTQNMEAKAEAHAQELEKRADRTDAQIEEEESEDWTGQKADIEDALSGRGNKLVLAPEE